jgi:hypothetical protein
MASSPSRRRRGRKLLVASIGVATVSYVLACQTTETSGNLVAPPPTEAGKDVRDDIISSGNLVAPPPPEDAGDSGNPSDASDAGDAADADGG